MDGNGARVQSCGSVESKEGRRDFLRLRDDTDENQGRVNDCVILPIHKITDEVKGLGDENFSEPQVSQLVRGIG